MTNLIYEDPVLGPAVHYKPNQVPLMIKVFPAVLIPCAQIFTGKASSHYRDLGQIAGNIFSKQNVPCCTPLVLSC